MRKATASFRVSVVTTGCVAAAAAMLLSLVAGCDDASETGSCESTCAASIALGCPAGEHDQASCVASCAGQQATCVSGGHASIFQAYLDCVESTPMSCGTTTQAPTSEQCVQEGLATRVCLQQVGPSLEGCPSLDASPNVVSETQMTASYPTPAGGAVRDGTYYLSRFEVYSPAVADSHSRSNRLDIRGGRIVVQTQSDSGAAEIKGGSATASGTSLKLVLDCPSSVTATIPFTASETELWFFDPAEPNIQVYARQETP
jgi:hypothetical protein